MHETRSRSLSRPATKRKREDSEGNVRSSSKVPRDRSGVRDVTMAKTARKINKISQRKSNLGARIGEADRRIFIKKPKHLCKLFILCIFILILNFLCSFRQTIKRQNRSTIVFVLYCLLLCFSESIKRKKKDFYERKKTKHCCFLMINSSRLIKKNGSTKINHIFL
jgi:prolipoprotein diacylglyceryltransferase